MLIKKKISLGLILIGTILLLSSAMAIYEFVRMRNTVSNLINDNISAINASRLLLEVTDEYNFKLLETLGDNTSSVTERIADDNRFSSYLGEVKLNFTTERERAYADSVMYAYTTYIIIMNDAPYVWQGEYNDRRSWYFKKLYPVYSRLRGYLQELTLTSQQALAENSTSMTDSFYRSIMPGVVSVVAGIVLILLFNYFLNFYFVNPLIKISKGISDYLQRRKSYILKIDGEDEISELNENVRELIEENKRLNK